ncbi:MAG: HDIG domain-containing protein [Deltaproteobacteria bacterium]|nr:HDIG domain-containing protein [Deltaproteobacteria bacterium]
MNPQIKNESAETPDEKPSWRERLREGWRHVLEGPGTGGKLLVVFLVAAFTAGSAWLLLPDRSGPNVSYDEADIGTFSVGVVKADRDYTIPDDETTKVKAEAARAAVLPVYDHDHTMGGRAARRVEEAFGRMRAAHQDLEAPEAPAPASRGEADDPQRAAREEGEGSEEEEAEVLDPAAVQAAYQEHKAEFLQVLQVVVDEDEFATLAEQRFSKAVEEAIASLVREAMDRLVVADRELIAAVTGQSIVVQRLPERDPRFERKIQVDGTGILDVAAVREKLNGRVEELLPDADHEAQKVVRRLARRLVGANLVYNADETQARRNRAAADVKPVVIQVARGERIIGDGERIEARHVLIFEGMREEAVSDLGPQYFAGAALLSLLFAFALFSFAHGSVWRFQPTRKDLIFLVVSLLGTLLAAKGGIFLMSALADRFPQVGPAAFFFAIPVAATPILVRLVLSGEVTLVFTAVLAVFVGLLADASLAMTIYVFAVSAVGADMVRRAKDRSSIWRAGLVLGLIGSVVAIGLSLMTANPHLQSVAVAAAAAASTFATVPFVVLGLTWFVERFFGYTTDFKLLELANVNNRLLKELVVAAPGTYQHSMVIGSIVEPAAEAIGANPLLARVGAYYHDIGKGRNPRYFAENQKGENPHDELTASMSALIIRRHVSDGIKMGREAGLPSQIVDMIPMHHGTRLMSYFWTRAKEEAEKKDEAPPAEVAFRHIGPKPRFREAAILMIADSVEAAARTVTEPNRDRFLGMIQKVINACFADGQFDECDITLKDLHEVARSFAGSLEAIYHSRPEYQQPAEKGERPKPEKEKNGSTPRAGEKKVEKAEAKNGEVKRSKTPPPGAPAVTGESEGAEAKAAPQKKGAKEGSRKKSAKDAPGPEKAPGAEQEPKDDAPAIADDERAAAPEAGAAEAVPEKPDGEAAEALKRLGS